MEIAPGLHQLRVPIPNNPVGFVLPYVFEVPSGLAIIDPGWNADESIDSLRDQLQELGAGFGDIRQIIVTHVHPDHYGMAGRLRDQSGAEVLIHEGDLAFIHRNFAGGALAGWLTKQGMPEEESAGVESSGGPMRGANRWPEPDRLMKDGELLKLGAYELRVIWTPGHSPGHACFYEEAHELLLTGDHVLPQISPNVSLQPDSDADPLGEYISSLEKLRGMRVKRVLPAHEYSFDDLEGRLDELEHHHEARLQEMLDAVDAGATTGYEVAQRIKWAIGGFERFNPWTRRAAMSETLAHLRYLERQNVLRVDASDGIERYERVRDETPA